MGDMEIAYQNKDITSKVLAEHFKGKTFKVYGLDLPQIERVLPTNLPAVKANELRLDNLFELADRTVALVDYESDYEEADKVKYLNYLARIADRYLLEKKACPILRMVVIYTGDIIRKRVNAEYNIGALRLTVEPAFLSELPGEEIYQRLKRKVERGERLDEEEMMEFIILPLSYRKKEEKEEKIRQIVDLATRIKDREQQLFTLSGILVFTDKVIDKEMAKRIRREIEMTQVAQIFEEEKRQALTQVTQIFEEEKRQALTQVAQIFEEEKRQALAQKEEEKQQALKENSKQFVAWMIKNNYPAKEIAAVVPNYSLDEVEKLKTEISKEEKR